MGKEHGFDGTFKKRAVKGYYEEEAQALENGVHRAGRYDCWSIYMDGLSKKRTC